jgi:hypothetical protein
MFNYSFHHRTDSPLSVLGSISVGVKTFNGCHWKGSKIRVATAHEYYLDKLESEKQIPLKPIYRTIFSPPKLFNEGAILKVKRRKNEHVYVGTGPAPSVQPRDILPSGKRRRFNEEGEYLEPLEILIPEDAPQKPVEAVSVETPVPPPQRKGLRIGFGSIASLPPRSVPSTHSAPPPSDSSNILHAPPCDTCVENEINIPEPEKGGRYGFDEGAKILTESGQYDELSSSDGENCLTPEEVTERSLNSERERQKRIFTFIQENVATLQSTVSGDVTTQEVSQEDIEPVPIIEQTKISAFRSAVWSETSLRFDPTLHRKSQKFHLTQEEVQERDRLLQKRDVAEVDASAAVSAVADLEKLKGIFHRDGGFSWDATGKGLVARDHNSTVKVDDLTLEAERYGFDVCEEEPTTATTSEQKEKKKDGNSMLFGFFEGNEQEGDLAQSDDQSDGSLEGDSSSDDSSDDGSDIFNENDGNGSDGGDDPALQKFASWRQQQLQEEVDHEFHYPSFDEVKATADKFKRDL